MRASQILTIFTSLQCLVTLAAQNNGNEEQQTAVVLHTNIKETELKDSQNLIQADIQRFYPLVKGLVFVDKTLLIEKIFARSTSSNILITYPRRWGKSVNLDMIRSFARMDFHRDGTEFDREKTSAYLLFKKGQFWDAKKERIYSMNLTDSLFLISQKQDIINEHLGRYFVIHLSLLIPCFGKSGKINYDDFMKRFKDQIIEIYGIYSFVWIKLKQIDHPSGVELTYIERFEAVLHGVGDVEWSKTVKYLCNAFQLCYPQHKILITIDEYDYAFNEINFRTKADYKSADAESIKDFIYNFLLYTSSRYDADTAGHEAQNEIKPKCIITGISRLAKTNIFTGMSDFEHWSMYNDETGQPFYGFTSAEVKRLSSLRGMDDNMFEELVSKYDGYRSRENLGKSIFNPIAIVKFLNSRIISDYWLQTGSKLTDQFPLIFKHFQLRYLIKLLLNTDTFIKIPNNALEPTTEQLDGFAEILRSGDRARVLLVEEAQCALGILLSTGYLGLSESRPENANYINIRIPNTELKTYFETQSSNYDSDHVASHFESLRSAAIVFNRFLNDLTTQNELESEIRSIFKESGPYGNFVNTIEKFRENSPDFISDIGFMHQNEAGAHFTMLEVLSLIRRRGAITLGSEVGFTYKSETEQTFFYRMDLACFNDASIMIIEMKADNKETIDNVLQQAEDYLLVFKNRPGCRVFKNYKLVAINVREHDDVEVKFKTLSHAEVLEYHTKWTHLEEEAIALFAEDRKLDLKNASLQWKDLAAAEAKKFLALARNKVIMPSSTTPLPSFSIPPEIFRNLPTELRRPLEDWDTADVLAFMAFFETTLGLSPSAISTGFSLCNGKVLIQYSENMLQEMLKIKNLPPETSNILYNSVREMKHKYSTSTTTKAASTGRYTTVAVIATFLLEILNKEYEADIKWNDITESNREHIFTFLHPENRVPEKWFTYQQACEKLKTYFCVETKVLEKLEEPQSFKILSTLDDLKTKLPKVTGPTSLKSLFRDPTSSSDASEPPSSSTKTATAPISGSETVSNT